MFPPRCLSLSGEVLATGEQMKRTRYLQDFSGFGHQTQQIQHCTCSSKPDSGMVNSQALRVSARPFSEQEHFHFAVRVQIWQFISPIQWEVTIMCCFNSPLFRAVYLSKMKGLSWGAASFVSLVMIMLKGEIIGNELKPSDFILQHAAVGDAALDCYFKYILCKRCLLCEVATGGRAAPWSCSLLPREVETWKHEKADYGFRSQPDCIIHSTSLQIQPHFH